MLFITQHVLLDSSGFHTFQQLLMVFVNNIPHLQKMKPFGHFKYRAAPTAFLSFKICFSFKLSGSVLFLLKFNLMRT